MCRTTRKQNKHTHTKAKTSSS